MLTEVSTVEEGKSFQLLSAAGCDVTPVMSQLFICPHRGGPDGHR